MDRTISDQGSENASLFVDLYELTMVQSYLREGMTAPAVFELFFRELPGERNFMVAAGLAPLLEMLEGLRFTSEQLDYLRAERRFSRAFLEYLAAFSFSGDVRAVPEGTVVFPNEPLVQVAAPLPEAQLIETLVINQLHFASLAASKAARMVLAAAGRRIIDFGSRRAHGMDAGLVMARAAYLAGFVGTSLVEAGRRYGIPVLGTMAHSFVQAHDDESLAYQHFLESFPEATLLVDTYDTLEGVRKVIDLSRRLGENFRVQALRLDSGNLLELARETRRLLDSAGLQRVQIVASGGLDEHRLAELAAASAPIDGYGVGTSLAVSEDAPSVDMVYKLVEYRGAPRTKLSSRKVMYPGRKQVFRHHESGCLTQDVLARADDALPGEPLLVPVMRGGRRIAASSSSLKESRALAREQLDSLPGPLREMGRAPSAYPVTAASSLEIDLQQLRVRYSQ